MEEKENIKSKFNEYMSKEVPGYENVLDDETLTNLLEEYNSWETFKKTAEYCMQRAMDSSSEVNYTNDFEKAMENSAKVGQKFNKELENIREIYGIEKEVGVKNEGKTRIN